jgi:sugar-phosphatase
MTRTRPVRALLFDLDGTLMDSETQTDEAISLVTARHGIPGFTLPHTETRGRTWAHVADTIRAQTSITLEARKLAAELLECWNEVTVDVKPVPGSPAALHAAAACGLKLGVVSSSPRSVINLFLAKLGVSDCVDPQARIGADAIRNGKPDPEGFLLGARRLGVDPADTVVFEDSQAGLLAAKAAGMRSVFITCCASDIAANAALATACTTDYRALPPGFWAGLADGSLDLAGKSYA